MIDDLACAANQMARPLASVGQHAPLGLGWLKTEGSGATAIGSDVHF